MHAGRVYPSRSLEGLCSHGPECCYALAREGALGTLGLVRRDDPATMLVAKAIMDAAKTGERDPMPLRRG
jgi:hypothetical protein